MSFGDMNFLFSLSGLGIGIVVGLTGVGGGSLMTPLLVLLFGIHPATAVGTDLLYAAATKSVGTAVHGRAKSVDWQVVRRLASGSIPATALAFLVMNAMGMQSSKGGFLAFLLGAVLLVTAATLLFRAQIVAYFSARVRADNQGLVRALTVATGVVIGALVMTTSVGAGAIGVTALLVLYPRLPTLRIVASDIAHAVPLTLVAGLAHWWMGDVDWLLLVTLLLGSIPGIIIGSLLAPKLPERALRMLLALVLVLVSLKLMGLF
ncbi:MAG: sulfite exporter TauE/SafE family protein [Candidatus Saccharibacteria bacterium]|nr:sulfite exporter TauE/SafE family protein [Pseudorhodobacter sp.]